MNSRSPRHTPTRAGPAVHRPASNPPPIAVASPLTFAPNAALLIDFDNVTMGIRSDLQTELKTLLASDIIKGKVQLRRAYADWRRYPQYVAPLAEASIDMIMAPAYGSSKKNATDIRLAIDALELVFTRPEIGTYILLSGDSDFSTLVIKLKEYGKYVIGVGIRESSSDLLVMNCDEYYSYNALAGLVRSGAEDEEAAGARRDPWELVSEALTRMVRNGDVMRADRLKQVMQDIDSTFDEKNLGMSKFSRFVQEAAQRGLLSLSKMDNGQLEVGPPRPAEAAAEGAAHGTVVPATAGGPGDGRASAAAQAQGAEPSERGEERGRRGRRGGRGRGREREARGARESAAPAAAADGAGETVVAAEAAVSEATGAMEAPIAEIGSGVAIGIAGERLTRDEAFDLVRRAVESAVTGDEAVRASDLRVRAFELLGHDSESLSERNFSRILRDAHDADVVDLRRRGDDYDVARAVAAEPVTQQLNAAAAAHALPTSQAAPTGGNASPAMPRGLGVRGMRRGGPHARGSTPPAELLAVGIVDVAPSTAASAEQGAVGRALEHPVELLPHAETSPPDRMAGAEHEPEAEAVTAESAGDQRARAARKRSRSRPKRSAVQAATTSAAKAKRGRSRAGTKAPEG